jgi:hypothetical protein
MVKAMDLSRLKTIRRELNQSCPIFLLMTKVLKENTRDIAGSLQRGERRRGDILLQNQTAHPSLSRQILRVSLITPVTHLISAAQVMTGEGTERDTPRRINASAEKESVTEGVREDVESVIGNQSRGQKG